MTRRLIAWGLVLALIVSVMPQVSLGVTAEEITTPPAEHSHAQNKHACEHCKDSNAPQDPDTWTAWGDVESEWTSLPNDTNHYYLVHDVSVTANTAISGSTDMVLCLNGYTIKGAQDCTPFEVTASTAKLTISDCTAGTGSDGVYRAGTIQNGHSGGGKGGGFYVNNGQLTIHNAIIKDNRNAQSASATAYSGGGIHVRASTNGSAKVTLNGVHFIHNTTTKEGGAICLRSGKSELIANDCIFEDNEAGNWGGAIYAMEGTVSLDGCEFKNNKAAGGGSAIHINVGAKLTLKDCTITGNTHGGTADTYRGAVYLANDKDKLTLVGTTRIYDNFYATDSSAPGERGIYLQNAVLVDVGGLTEGASVTIHNKDEQATADKVVTAATQPAVWERTWVVYENNSMAVDYSTAKGFHFAKNTDHIHCQCGIKGCTESDHETVEYMPWPSKTELPDAGDYYLTQDVTLEKEEVITGDLNLCLNGKNITVKEGVSARVMSTGTNSNATFVISDCEAKTVDGVYTAGKITGGVDTSKTGGGAIFVRTGSHLILFDGIITKNTSVLAAGGVLLQGNADFTMYGGEISGNKAVKADGTWRNGGGLYIQPGCNAKLLGGKICDNEALNGAGVFVTGTDAVLTVDGTEICHNTAHSGGGAVYAEKDGAVKVLDGKIHDNEAIMGAGLYGEGGKVVLTVSGGEISKNISTKAGAGISVNNGCTLNISGDALISENENKTTYGGGISYGTNTTGTISGGVIEKNKAPDGAGILIQSGAKVTIQDVTVQNNETTKNGGGVGGGIYVYASSLTMTGGTVTGNIATKNGGGICAVAGSEIDLRSVSVTGNTASVLGGGVYAEKGITLSVSGAPLVKDNSADNLYLCDGMTMNVGTMDSAASVGVTANVGPISGQCQDYAPAFVSDSAYRKVAYVDGALHIVAGGEHKHCLCDSTVSGCDHSNLTWAAWDKTNSLPDSGNYYLLYDVVLEEEEGIPGDLNLCLNGKTISVKEGVSARVMSTNANSEASLVITDCTAKTVDGVYTAGKITGGVDTSKTGGGGIFVRTGCELILFDGIITGNTSVLAAGGVLLQKNADFTMYGGEISGNSAITAEGAWKEGGGLYIQAGCKAKLLGGKICDNEASNGAGVFVTSTDAVLTVDGTEICHNTAHSGGGGVYAKANGAVKVLGGKIHDNTAVMGAGLYGEGGKVVITVSGGQISKNISTKAGAGISVREGCTLNISGDALISENECQTTYGGGISYGTNTTGTISGGVIEKNKAPSGAGMLIQSGAKVTVTDVKVQNNTATKVGGGIYVYASGLTMTGGTVSGNTAVDGGGISFGGEATGTVSGAIITQNTVSGSGAGIYGDTATLTLSGVTVTDNHALKDGGGVNFRAGNMDISGKTLISGNTSKTVGGGVSYGKGATGTISGGIIEKNVAGHGGGLIVQNGANVVMSGGTIQNHSVTGSGGGVYLYKSTMTMTGGTVTKNTSKVGAGGIYVKEESAFLLIDGGTISNNTSKNGAGMLLENRSTVELKSGKITGNTTDGGSGAGAYVSTNTNFKMTGGTISNNVAYGAGGGLYGLRSTLTLSGGSITGNRADGDGGGGIYVRGAKAYLYGTSLTYNTTKGNGGGLCTHRIVVKQNGVETNYTATVYMSGSYVAHNEAKIAGGILVQGTGCKMEMTGGSIVDNSSTGGCGGLYISNKCSLDMSGGTIARNEAGTVGGGMYFYRGSTVNATGGKVHDNTSEAAGGGIYIYRGSTASFKNVSICDNTSGTLGGGVYGDSIAQYASVAAFENCTFSGNTAGTQGGAFCGAFDTEFSAIGCTFTDNTAVGTETVIGNGGAVAVRDVAYLENCTFSGNKAVQGGAFYGGNLNPIWAVNGWGAKGPNVGVDIYNCTFTDNDASRNGGAMYLASSAFTDMQNTTFTGNTAAEHGSAIYAVDDLTMQDVTVTGNVAANNGSAVFLADAEYDGQTYIRGLFKFGGDIIITDNQGGDLYLDNQVTVTALYQGYGEKTHMDVTLDKGVLTQRMYGAYNYEGGNQVYTVTYGDRSLTDPEYDESLVVGAKLAAEDGLLENVWLYVGVGAVAVAILAVSLLLVLKKKKTKATADVSEE